MDRVAFGIETDLLANTLAELPPRIRRLVASTQFVIGVDPVFIGLHPFRDTGDGRSFRTTSHMVPRDRQHTVARVDRAPTVVLLEDDWKDREIILHELGHAVDEAIGGERPTFQPLGRYAATSSDEAFATAFQAWASPRVPDRRDHGLYSRDDLAAIDTDAIAFFDSLANNSFSIRAGIFSSSARRSPRR